MGRKQNNSKFRIEFRGGVKGLRYQKASIGIYPHKFGR